MTMTQDAAVRACRGSGVLRMDFQPIIDTARGTVVGYESLARFSGPPHATPDRWFAVARAAGIGAELEARALRTALEARSALPPNCFLSVNVGPDALLAAPVAAVFAGAGDLRGVVVEITEQVAVTCYDALITAIAPLRTAGALLAVDDAGAGFASLKHITVLRPDFVKVDRDLVAGIDADETKAAVVEALGMITSRLDAWLIAEGVETDRRARPPAVTARAARPGLRARSAETHDGGGPPRGDRAVPAAEDRRHLWRAVRGSTVTTDSCRNSSSNMRPGGVDRAHAVAYAAAGTASPMPSVRAVSTSSRACTVVPTARARIASPLQTSPVTRCDGPAATGAPGGPSRARGRGSALCRRHGRRASVATARGPA